MSKLEKNKELLEKINDNKLKKAEKDLLIIYKKGLKNIRVKMLETAEKSSWTLIELRKYGRLEKLQNEILEEIKKLSVSTYTGLKKFNTDMILLNHSRSAYGYVKEVGVFLDFQKLNPEKIKNIVTQPYPGVDLSSFIKKIGAKTFDKIKIAIGTGLTTGESLVSITSEVKKIMGASFHEAFRVVRTESMRAASKAQLDVTDQAIDMGLDVRKRWLSTLDFRTRDTHVKIDKQLADKEGFFHIGQYKAVAPRLFGVASEDIQCRCSYTEEIKNITQKITKRFDNITKKFIDNMSYQDWLDKYYGGEKSKEKIKKDVDKFKGTLLKKKDINRIIGTKTPKKN